MHATLMSPVTLLIFAALVVVTLLFVGYWIAAVRRAPPPGGATPAGEGILIGFIINFFDTLGIGSFAPTTSIFRLTGMVADEQIPGTLNVGHALPTVAEALIFIAAVKVGSATLVAMIASSVLGAWLGAGVVANLPRRSIRLWMGVALVTAAVLFSMANLGLMPGGGETLSLEGWRFAAGVAANFVLGALMTLGIGLFAPCMILVALLGMNPIAAFPIMMGSCAFLMPVGSVTFIRKRSYNLRAALGLAVGGVPGVLLAAYVVKSLPLVALRWLVVAVVIYTATGLLRAAFQPSPPSES